jgi:hypothetical protein
VQVPPPATDPAASLAALAAANEAAAAQAAAAKQAEIAAYLADEKRKADEAGMAEVDRLKAEKDRADARIAELEQQAALTVAAGVVRDALLAADCPAAALADVALMIPATAGMTPDQAKTAVDGLKARLPAVFAATPAGPAPAPAPPGVPAASPPPAPAATDAEAQARAVMARRGITPRSTPTNGATAPTAA